MENTDGFVNTVHNEARRNAIAEQRSITGNFVINLDLFAGPIDLLLHLVKLRELEIEKVSLAAVADQYLSLLTKSKIVDIDLASEYLVIAATLLSVKASCLLAEPITIVSTLDDEEDPAEELLRRLREAEVFRQGASRLSMIPQLGIDVFDSISTDRLPVADEGVAPHDAAKLAKAFEKVLAARKFQGAYIVERDAVPVSERMRLVTERVTGSAGISFFSLFNKGDSRAILVTTFIAILELCKQGIVRVQGSREVVPGATQSKHVLLDSEDLYLVSTQAEPLFQEFSSEFDEAEQEQLPKTANG